MPLTGQDHQKAVTARVEAEEQENPGHWTAMAVTPTREDRSTVGNGRPPASVPALTMA